MIIPTLGHGGYLYAVNKHRIQWMTELERRKAFCYFIGLFACISVLIYIWILA